MSKKVFFFFFCVWPGKMYMTTSSSRNYYYNWIKVAIPLKAWMEPELASKNESFACLLFTLLSKEYSYILRPNIILLYTLFLVHPFSETWPCRPIFANTIVVNFIKSAFWLEVLRVCMTLYRLTMENITCLKLRWAKKLTKSTIYGIV